MGHSEKPSISRTLTDKQLYTRTRVFRYSIHLPSVRMLRLVPWQSIRNGNSRVPFVGVKCPHTLPSNQSIQISHLGPPFGDAVSTTILPHSCTQTVGLFVAAIMVVIRGTSTVYRPAPRRASVHSGFGRWVEHAAHAASARHNDVIIVFISVRTAFPD